jgi:hypothetical protein
MKRAPLLLWLAACAAGGPDDLPPVDGPDFEPLPLDDVLRLNHLQGKGTHNSYHVRPATLAHPSHDYTHAPLYEQLSELDVRQLELDLHWHETDGLQVFHLPGVDEETTCLAFADCLGELARFSDDHPGHLPVLVWLEPKHTDLDFLVPELGDLDLHWAEVEAAILEVIGRERVFAPDDLRGELPTVREAVEARGWPQIGAVRGRFLFSVLDDGESRAAYLGTAAALGGKLLFVDSVGTDEPSAALFKDMDAARGAELGLLGFLTTDNVGGASDLPEDNRARAEAQLAAGVHYLATDLPGPVEGRDDHLDLGGAARCNLVTAPPACDASVLEPVY